MSNTLAYFKAKFIKVVKSFMIQASRDDLWNDLEAYFVNFTGKLDHFVNTGNIVNGNERA